MSQYNYANRTPIIAVSQAMNWIELHVPPRGKIRSILLKQVSGGAEGFYFDVFNSARARAAEIGSASGSSVSSDGSGNVDPELFRVMPRKTVAAGHDTLEEFTVEYDYRNADGSPSNLKRRLYLRLTPNGTGTKEFQMSMLIDLPSLLG